MTGSGPQAPGELREGVREGILAALGRDVELRAGRTAGRLVSAGVVGVAGAVGAMLLVTNHPFGHHPHWHEMVFSAIWAGLLVISFSLVFLQLRTPHLPLAGAAAVGLLALGLAGICSLLCPDPHVLDWWFRTAPGARLAADAGALGSALCFGATTAFGFAAIPAMCFLKGATPDGWVRTVSAAWVFVLLLPGVLLESVGMPAGVLAGWTGGTAAGAYAGVACGVAIARRLRTG
jgi:hypothetical protein